MEMVVRDIACKSNREARTQSTDVKCDEKRYEQTGCFSLSRLLGIAVSKYYTSLDCPVCALVHSVSDNLHSLYYTGLDKIELQK